MQLRHAGIGQIIAGNQLNQGINGDVGSGADGAEFRQKSNRPFDRSMLVAGTHGAYQAPHDFFGGAGAKLQVDAYRAQGVEQQFFGLGIVEPRQNRRIEALAFAVHFAEQGIAHGIDATRAHALEAPGQHATGAFAQAQRAQQTANDTDMAEIDMEIVDAYLHQPGASQTEDFGIATG